MRLDRLRSHMDVRSVKRARTTALACSAALVIVAGCGHVATTGVIPGDANSARLRGAMHSAASTDHILYNFGAGSGGINPQGSLLFSGGIFYGTTQNGGKFGNGTVFKMDPAGRVTILHNFGPVNGKDAQQPYAGLIEVKGTFYGTTAVGGASGNGAVFSITPGGSERVLYSFNSSSDAKGPEVPLVYANGALYGTAGYSGTNYQPGSIFSVTLDGKEKVVHIFTDSPDGATPLTPLTLGSDGLLYGTTSAGGAQGQGVAYSLSAKGKIRIIHSFGVNDNSPNQLLEYNGVLYGTTLGNTSSNVGTYFSLTPAGKYRLLYRFLTNGGLDATYPLGGLVRAGEKFYGVSGYGGSGAGGGSVFWVTTTGQEGVVYGFGSVSKDGVLPSGGVIYVNHALYGMTYHGGSHPTLNNLGGGTVYTLKP